MRIHHINCGTMCPFGGRLVSGSGSLFAAAKMVCHCLLIETPSAGLVLVDTGLGLADLKEPKLRLGTDFVALTRPLLDLDETAAHQVLRLGFELGDVRHIVVTHLDLDHAGGLPDFPQAKVHIFDEEVKAALAPRTYLEGKRYRPAHFAHNPDWVRYQVRGEPWFGFPCVRQLDGLPPEILLVPLIGHTRGHCGVAVNGRAASAPGGSRWLLHAGDAYFNHRELDPEKPSCPPALSAFQRIVEVDRKSRLLNQERLRQLHDQHRDVQIFSAHDPVELEAMAGLAAASAKVAA